MTRKKPQLCDTWKVMDLVCDYCHSRIIKVQPRGNLPIGDNENIPNPRSMPLNGSQGVSQLFVILKTAGRDILILLRLRKTFHM